MSNILLADVSVNGRGYYGIGAPAVSFSNELYTYLRITDINDDGTLNLSDLKSVAAEQANEYLLCKNDIVFARTGASTGRNYFYDGTDGKFVYAGFLIKFSIDPLKINPKYVKYYCLSKQYKDWIRSFTTGSTRGNINAQTLSQMPIPMISRKQQDILVDILSSIDNKIRQNTTINNNLEQQAQAIIKDYYSSIQNEIELGSILSFVNGFAFKSSSYLSQGTYKVITIKNVQDGIIDSQGATCLDELPTQMKSECLLVVGDVLLSLTGNVGRVGIVYEDNLLLNQRVAKFVPHNDDMLPYLYFSFRLHSMKTTLEMISKGTAQQNLSPVETLKLKIPFDRSALAISKTLRPLFDTIVENQKQNKRLAELRDLLLPKLMSGELDASEIDL